MKATWSATRIACCRLCVTITIATLCAQADDQLLDRRGGDRVERRAGLVKQQYLGAGGKRARDAQPLLLASGEAQRGMVEVAGHLLVETGTAQSIDHGSHQLVARAPFAPARTPLAVLLAQRVGDILEDAHREGIGLLEDHRDAPAERVDLDLADLLPVERHAPGTRGARGDLGEAVERAQ